MEPHRHAEPDVPVEERLRKQVAGLPTGPGVYLYRDVGGVLLYVGKAQNLRSRVNSYFSGSDGRYQIPRLVARIAEIEVLVTPSGKDALLLENELIKRHKPPFNIRLRDDKQYLALRLDPNEHWPRLSKVRRFRKDGAEYFGPYTSGLALAEALAHLRRIFPLRSCTQAVFRDYARRGRPCLEYEMKRCLGPCCDRVTPDAYSELVDGTLAFLRGRSEELIESYRTQMQDAAQKEDFETAAGLRDRIAAIAATLSRQEMVAAHQEDRDVIGLAREGDEVQVQILHVRAGRVIGAEDYGLSKVCIDDAEILSSFLAQFYAEESGHSVPRKLVLPVRLPDDEAVRSFLAERAGGKVACLVPQRGPVRKLLGMANDNAKLRLTQRMDVAQSFRTSSEQLARRLGLAKAPVHIECYDVSNLMGTFAVASRVVFKEGMPSKADYRRYRIREAKGGDDVGCLREVLARRFERAASEPLPDLLMVDGGRGQLAVVMALLEDHGMELPALGLAKEVDHDSPSARVKRGGGLKAEKIFVPGRKNPIFLPPHSKALLLLQRIRDESHRFAIEFQRALQRKSKMQSVLEEIPGIGPTKRRKLLRELGSLRGVREATLEQLRGVRGISAEDASAIRNFFDSFETIR